MKYIAIVLVTAIFFSRCSESPSSQTLLTTNNLPAQVFSISTDKDTLLTTLHGSKIRVAAGTFSINGLARITVKEAFSPAEILAAGLSATSNGRPLRSGGMIYFNATVNNQETSLVKAIKISVPNTYIDSAMQLFSGVETTEGINWVDPQPFTDTPLQKQRWNHGRSLFLNNCASCHSLFKTLTGPPLAFTNLNPAWKDQKRLYSYIRNAASWGVTDPYIAAVKKQYGGAVMTSFPALGDSSLIDLFYYLETERKRNGNIAAEKNYLDNIPQIRMDRFYKADSNTKENSIPCKTIDTVYMPLPKPEIPFINMNKTEDTDIVMDTLPVPTTNQPDPPESGEGMRRGFNDPNPTGGMYDFEIRTMGWYNIDAFVEGYDGTRYIKLQVELQMNIETDMHIYLFCPDRKMLSVAYGKEGPYYIFDKIEGRIPLFPGDRAMVFAFGSKGEQMYYGITPFRVEGDRIVQVTVKETTETEIRKALQAQQLDGIDLGIEKKIEKIIERPCNETRPMPGVDTFSQK